MNMKQSGNNESENIDLIERVTISTLDWFGRRGNDLERHMAKMPDKYMIALIWIPLVICFILVKNEEEELGFLFASIPVFIGGVPFFGYIVYLLIAGPAEFSKYLRSKGIERGIARLIVSLCCFGLLSVLSIMP